MGAGRSRATRNLADTDRRWRASAARRLRPCIGLGIGLLEKGEVGISATNRNFKGRMGSRDAQCYLASPEVVAASAVAGYIRGPRRIPRTDASTRNYRRNSPPGRRPRRSKSSRASPSVVKGRLVFMPQDNVNTDAIYGKDYTYREDMTPEMMAKVVMENYDPQFAARTQAGDVIVGGFNFGTGSSREQAVTCLKAKGIPLVIAASFSQTYLRNAYNNGFLVHRGSGAGEAAPRSSSPTKSRQREDDHSRR